MAVSVLVFHPHDHMVDSIATAPHHGRALYQQGSLGKDPNSKSDRRAVSTECVSLLHHHKVEKL